jgi:hypothetical protein
MAGPAPQQFMLPASVSTISADQPLPTNSTLPRPWEMVLHPVKMIRFVNSLWRDPRISWVRKLLYLVPLLVLLVAVLLPEGIIATVLAGFVPILGPLLNVPADAAIDWVMLGLAAYALLGIFPKQIVRESHARSFHPAR